MHLERAVVRIYDNLGSPARYGAHLASGAPCGPAAGRAGGRGCPDQSSIAPFGPPAGIAARFPVPGERWALSLSRSGLGVNNNTRVTPLLQVPSSKSPCVWWPVWSGRPAGAGGPRARGAPGGRAGGRGADPTRGGGSRTPQWGGGGGGGGGRRRGGRRPGSVGRPVYGLGARRRRRFGPLVRLSLRRRRPRGRRRSLLGRRYYPPGRPPGRRRGRVGVGS